MKITKELLKDREFNEHISDMKLALFLDNKLDDKEREEVFEHLAYCKRCRDTIKVAREIEKESKPINNIDYIGYIEPFMPLIAGVIIFFGVPYLDEDNYLPQFKSVNTTNILDRALDYWEEKFEEWFFSKK